MKEPLQQHLGSLVTGLVLATCGTLAILYFWNRRDPEPPSIEPKVPTIEATGISNTRRAVGIPYRVAQSLQVDGPISAKFCVFF